MLRVAVFTSSSFIYNVHKYINKKFWHKVQEDIRYTGKETIKQMGQGLIDKDLMVL